MVLYSCSFGRVHPELEVIAVDWECRHHLKIVCAPQGKTAKKRAKKRNVAVPKDDGPLNEFGDRDGQAKLCSADKLTSFCQVTSSQR